MHEALVNGPNVTADDAFHLDQRQLSIHTRCIQRAMPCQATISFLHTRSECGISVSQMLASDFVLPVDRGTIDQAFLNHVALPNSIPIRHSETPRPICQWNSNSR
jgi:hypothetical protein